VKRARNNAAGAAIDGGNADKDRGHSGKVPRAQPGRIHGSLTVSIP